MWHSGFTLTRGMSGLSVTACCQGGWIGSVIIIFLSRTGASLTGFGLVAAHDGSDSCWSTLLKNGLDGL